MASNDNSKMDKKLDYLEATKLLIQQALINKDVTITSDTPFREYADKINNLQVATDQSDATATANDIVAGKIAYNNNNKVIGNISTYKSIVSEATEVTEDTTNNTVRGTYNTDSRVLLDSNAKITIDIPYDKIPSYKSASIIADDILGIK